MAFINGEGYSFASLRMSLLGNPLVAGFKAISYSKSQAKQNSMGIGGLPVERTRGDITFEGSISLTVKEVIRIREAAGKKSLVDIPPFAISLSYANGVDPATTDVLEYVEFTTDAISSSQGDTEIVVEIPMIVGDIKYNQ